MACSRSPAVFILEPLGSGAKRRSGRWLGSRRRGCALDQIVKDSTIISEITYASLYYRKWLGQIKEKSGGRYGRGFKLGISRPACSGSLGLRRLKSDLEDRSVLIGAAASGGCAVEVSFRVHDQAVWVRAVRAVAGAEAV